MARMAMLRWGIMELPTRNSYAFLVAILTLFAGMNYLVSWVWGCRVTIAIPGDAHWLQLESGLLSHGRDTDSSPFVSGDWKEVSTWQVSWIHVNPGIARGQREHFEAHGSDTYLADHRFDLVWLLIGSCALIVLVHAIERSCHRLGRSR